MMWQSEDVVDIVNYSSNHIHIWVQSTTSGKFWMITGFYGYPEKCKRKASRSLLSQINPNNDSPWCVLGDFNEILTQDEKVCGSRRPQLQMAEFRAALGKNGLFDIGWRNQNYT